MSFRFSSSFPGCAFFNSFAVSSSSPWPLTLECSVLSLWSSSLPTVIHRLVTATSHSALKSTHTKHKLIPASRVMDPLVYLTSPRGYPPDILNAVCPKPTPVLFPYSYVLLTPTKPHFSCNFPLSVDGTSSFQLLRLKTLESSLTAFCLLHCTSNLPKYIVLLIFLSVSYKNISFMKAGTFQFYFVHRCIPTTQKIMLDI